MTANWGIHVPAPTFNAKGIPIYDLGKAEILVPPDPLVPFRRTTSLGLLRAADG
jgi:hypothetical protein